MKTFLSSIFLFLILSVLGTFTHTPFDHFIGTKSAVAAPFKNQPFKNVFWFYGPSGRGAANGLNQANAAAIADGDIWAIPAGTVIEKVYVIVDTALTGTTALEIGDDDNSAGFVDNRSITLGSAGMYGYGPSYVSGNYLKQFTVGASAPTVVSPSAKYYSASGKEIKLNNTTTNTAGAFRVVVEGYYLTQ
jgi:hypothetical protein